MVASPAFDQSIRHTIEQGTSIKAVDTSRANQMVGVRAHRIQRRGEVDDFVPALNDPLGSKLGGFMAFTWDRLDFWNRFEVDTIVHGKFLSVLKEYRGQNIAGKMMEATMDWMRQERIPLIYVPCSSIYTVRVLKRLNFEVIDKFDYSEFKVDGKQVLFPKEPHTAFTSCVKFVE